MNERDRDREMQTKEKQPEEASKKKLEFINKVGEKS